MFGLDKYKDALGKPRVGFHSARIPYVDYALNDVLGTIVVTSVLVLLLATDKSPKNMLLWIAFAFVLGIFLHIIFGVKTKMTEDLLRATI